VAGRLRGVPRAGTAAVTDPAMRQVVLVSGAPGAGKSTLARPLAAELGFTLLAKDRIKETLHEWLGLQADLAWSQRLGAASMELLWALAADAPAVVLEANFWPGHPLLHDRLTGLGAALVEVHCVCPMAECQRRYAERAPARHGVHVVTELTEQAFAQCEEPVGVGRVLRVDTSQPVQIALLADQVRREIAVVASRSVAGALPGATSTPAGMSEGTVNVA
jgi:predicted kinase